LGQHFDSQRRGPNDSCIGGQGLGLLSQLQTLEDLLFLAAIMAVEELTQLAWGDLLQFG
jgi:hypothetical protein